MTGPATPPTESPAQKSAPGDEGRPLATLPRGPLLELRIRLKTYQDHPYIDVREWHRRTPTADWWPVKGKGVSIKMRELAEVIVALEGAGTPKRNV